MSEAEGPLRPARNYARRGVVPLLAQEQLDVGAHFFRGEDFALDLEYAIGPDVGSCDQLARHPDSFLGDVLCVAEMRDLVRRLGPALEDAEVGVAADRDADLFDEVREDDRERSVGDHRIDGRATEELGHGLGRRDLTIPREPTRRGEVGRAAYPVGARLLPRPGYFDVPDDEDPLAIPFRARYLDDRSRIHYAEADLAVHRHVDRRDAGMNLGAP